MGSLHPRTDRTSVATRSRIAAATVSLANWCRGSAVAAADDGGALALGYFTEPVRFGAGTPTEVGLDSSGGFNYDGFAARYDATGALVCAVSIGGAELDLADDAALLPDGSWWVSATYGGSIALDAFGPYTESFTAIGAQDLVVSTWWF